MSNMQMSKNDATVFVDVGNSSTNTDNDVTNSLEDANLVAKTEKNIEHSRKMTYDTIVIGLGAAGVTAATMLARAGRRVLGVEAQDRVGGRVMTVPFGDGVVELGAEWMHGTKNNRAYDLAIQNKIPIVDQDLTLGVYRSDGEVGDAPLINELTEYCFTVADDVPSIPGPVGQYVTKRFSEYLSENHPKVLDDTDFVNEFLDYMNLFFNNYNASNNWNDITTHSKFTPLEGHQHVSWQNNGFKTFFEILLNTYNNGPGLRNLDIKLNKEVTLIKLPNEKSGNVEVICKDGERFVASNVIVTVSLGVLKERHSSLFSPSLPLEKVQAIKNLTMGVMDKIVLKFDKQWWPNTAAFFVFLWKGEDKRRINAEDYWTTRIFACSTPKGSKNSLTLWTSGDIGKMVEILPEALVIEKCMGLLKRFMGKSCNITEPTGILRSTWHSNPYTKGSYTYDHVNAHQYPNAREQLAESLTDISGTVRVLFAGEATDPIHFSTVHGASDSGYKAAMKLLPKSKI